jgi:hypothetical protein
MLKFLGLMSLMCINASAGLVLVLTDPAQAAAPGADVVFHGNLFNTDSVSYNIVSFVMLNPPTDSTTLPVQLFPFSEPAVPFQIAAGGEFIGVLVDFAVPVTAEIRSHSFAVEAATDTLGTNGQTIVSNNAGAVLNVVPEPGTAILVWVCLAGIGFTGSRRRHRLNWN